PPSLTLRRPPPPSPFPYTTLFRSDPVALAQLFVVGDGHGAAVGQLLPEPLEQLGADQLGGVPAGAAVAELLRVEQGRPLGQGPLDRKSTRLNSSHVKVSYAVFCLK